MMTSIVEQITALGVEVEHIPGGCTDLCQPVDIGVNKPFKHQIHQQWEQWMIDIVGLQGEPRGVLHQGRTLLNEMIINSWRHGEEDTWFPAN